MSLDLYKKTKDIKLLVKVKDEKIVTYYKETGSTDNLIWAHFLHKYENCIFKLMRNANVCTDNFRVHPLYAYMTDGVRYALNNYIVPEGEKGKYRPATFFTFLHSTLRNIFMRRYFSSEKKHTMIVQDPRTKDSEEVAFTDKPKPKLFKNLDAADEIDNRFSESFIKGCVLKLHYGVDCKGTYKASQLQRIVPEYMKLKATGFKLPSSRTTPPSDDSPQ